MSLYAGLGHGKCYNFEIRNVEREGELTEFRLFERQARHRMCLQRQ